MLGCHVTRRGTEWKLCIKARWPAIAAAVAVGTAEDRQVVFGEIHAGIVPRVAVATISGLHRDQRCFRCVA